MHRGQGTFFLSLLFFTFMSNSLLVEANVGELGHENLRMYGNIIAQSCDVGTTNADVHIGDFPQNKFETAGDTSEAKGFDIKLMNCSSGIAGSYITFSGDSDVTYPDLLALKDTTGSGSMASNVAVQILDSKGAPIALNKQANLQPLIAGDNIMHFQLRYKATNVPVKPGNANSVMYFDIKYQ